MGSPKLPPEVTRDMGLTALLVGPARALGLLRRVPELFTERHWPHYDDAIVVAVAAVSCVSVGARGQRWRVPPRATMLGEQWATLGALDDGKPTAEDIVRVLELNRMLDPGVSVQRHQLLPDPPRPRVRIAVREPGKELPVVAPAAPQPPAAAAQPAPAPAAPPAPPARPVVGFRGLLLDVATRLLTK